MIADYKFKLATARISLQLCLLGLLVGALASGLIVLFQLAVAGLQHLVLIQSGDFTELPLAMRAGLPILGAGIIYLLVSRTKTAYRRMGIAYVIHRVKCHYGRISLTSGVGQFIHAVVALACGFSVGKEGPAVHIGATAATMMSKRWALPDNTMRILSSCGIAAGIAAIFNTPLAGVIFVLEVVLRDYKIHYFLPIMLAAITGAIIYRTVFGDIHVYSHLELVRLPLDQYPTLIMFGLVLGIVAALFNHALLQVTQRASTLNLATRFGIAGLATAVIAVLVPGAMGSEHGAVSLAHSADATILGLLVLLTAKILATIAAIGFGIPGGLIGPLYGMGALLGAMVALILSPMLPQLQEYQGIYAAIGMTAMMGVCLNAPMASLLALVELTNDASLILPYLLVTLPGFLLAHEGLGARAIFLRQLDIMGLEYRVPPLEQALQKTGVLALMDRDIVLARPGLADDELLALLKSVEHHRLLRGTEEGQELITLHADFTDDSNSALKREALPGLPERATLAEVYQLLEPKRGGAVYIYMDNPNTPVGLITWSMLYRFFRGGEI
ncbi:chloride channel protein [Ferrimonas balearica]|uniref:chloride channel protein n=1 Tax=Ferrimonas balearica TaxID=44012 RepID=UPI001C584680|nr:chloride channel protein [Ferrimonas balearica]MBY6017806.1 chloride channel protein [Halomonas denitrificans]MBW3139706.1 chloride channel protein [Ferrimonas balearica]MBW3164730.1 chloride channel protein [Ferrimonas balearica]MBY6107188.1 chloride channel protein [Ferrimonas balearica]MBY6224256.1 chloride channel protein [Ferrimonas balearica]